MAAVEGIFLIQVVFIVPLVVQLCNDSGIAHSVSSIYPLYWESTYAAGLVNLVSRISRLLDSLYAMPDAVENLIVISI